MRIFVENNSKKYMGNHGIKCPYCNKEEDIVKNGIIKHKAKERQRFLCKNCNRNFYPEFTQSKIDKCRQAIIMYLEGMNKVEIEAILKVDRYDVRRWIKKYGKDLEEIRNNRIVESMKIEEVYAVTPNESTDAEYPYKNTYHNDGFTIIEKEDKTHITFLKGKQRFTVVFRANKEKPIEHILEPE